MRKTSHWNGVNDLSVDQVLSLCDIDAGRLQLVGITALWIGSKLEEYYPAELTKLTYLTEDSYTLRQILHMEGRILQLINFQLHYPDPMVFLKRFSHAAILQDGEMFFKTCRVLQINKNDCLNIVPVIFFWQFSKN